MKVLRLAVLSVSVWAMIAVPAAPLHAQTDLDAFMKQVIARRDDNWKKLQQYILDEHEQVALRGPGKMPLWGERRDYTWFLRDGFFVRSPLAFNGVTIGPEDRRKYEDDYLRREQQRDKRDRERAARMGGPGGAAAAPESSVEGLIAQTREPGFVSSAYFLKFKFEEGKYALVGRETLDGRDLLKVEYYPARLFSDDTDRNRRRADRGEKLSKDAEFDQQLETAMNKVSMVTLWVEPKTHQIVKYVFSNVNMDFLPGGWLARVDDLSATMTMAQPFAKLPTAKDTEKDVWLPNAIDMSVAMSAAIGQFTVSYTIAYADYRLAETSSRIK